MIAQQDYIHIWPENATTIVNDAAALGAIRKALELGTIWDCILYNICVREGDGIVNSSRVLAVYLDNNGPDSISIYDAANSGTYDLEVVYTATQYSGLAAIQEGERIILGEKVASVALLAVADGHLIEDNEGFAICVGGKYLAVETSGSVISSIQIMETGPEVGDSYVDISWEDAQKLIGLPLV